jgi:mercuric ion transport protein
VVPLVLVTVGVSGAWIGNLTALEPYQPIFAALALICIGLGFWHVYFRAKGECIDASSCAAMPSRVVTKAVLWFASALTIIALTTNWWAPLFY